MIYEIAEIFIKDGHEMAFEKAVLEAQQYFGSAAGCISFTLHRGIESRLNYQLFICWETLEHHTITFRNSEGFHRWRELASPHFVSPPEVKHVEVVFNNNNLAESAS
jgi:heme-degrading monooxygenase HmoA